MAGRPANLRINITSDSNQARQDVAQTESFITRQMNSLKQAGPAIAAAAGAAIGAALIAGIGEALDQGRIKNRLAAQLGATPGEAKKIGKVAGQLFSEGIVEDFQTAADAISATMRAGLADPGATEAQIRDISRTVSDLASTFEQDSTQVARAVAQMIKTGLADSSTEAFNTLTRGFQTGANAADDLLDTFAEYSTQFRDMGLSGEEAMGLISQGLAGGARDADLVADALKELNLRVKGFDPGAVAGLKQLGLNADEMARAFAEGGPIANQALDTLLDRLNTIEDPVKRNQVAFALLGTQAEDLAGALFNLDPSEAVDALGQLDGAAKQLSTTLREGPEAELAAFKRSAQQNMVEFIAEYILPAVRDLANFWDNRLSPALRTLLNLIRDGSDDFALLRRAWDLLTNTVEDNKVEIDLLLDVLKPLVKLFGGSMVSALAIIVSSFAAFIAIVGRTIDELRDLYHWLKDIADAILSLPSLPSFDIPGIDLFSATGAPALAGARGLSGAPGFGAAAALSSTTFRSTLQVPLTVNVTIDGQQLQARIDRTVAAGLNTEGARFQGRGWY